MPSKMEEAEAQLFLRHERFRRIERLFRAGFKAHEIAEREHIPLHIVISVLSYLRVRSG